MIKFWRQGAALLLAGVMAASLAHAAAPVQAVQEIQTMQALPMKAQVPKIPAAVRITARL